LGVLLTAGEFFFDLIFFNLRRLPRMGEELVTENFALELGGGAVTTALTAARLGQPVGIATVLGSSALDQFALQQLAARGVGCDDVRQEKGKIGGLTVAVSLRHDRYFLTSAGANAGVESYLLEPGVRARLARAQHVHFGLSPRRWEPFSELVEWLHARGVTTSWDLGWHPEAVRQSGFRALFGRLSVVFLNRPEALRYARAATPREALQRMARRGQCFVIKLGAQGAMALGPEGSFHRAPGLKVRARETTGAGDAFNGGFLYAWMSGAGLANCLRAGNVCGALSTTAPGGSAATPTRAQLKRGLKQLS
jgi:sugar/nucleoside kinase (ribokinase family)